MRISETLAAFALAILAGASAQATEYDNGPVSVFLRDADARSSTASEVDINITDVVATAIVTVDVTASASKPSTNSRRTPSTHKHVLSTSESDATSGTTLPELTSLSDHSTSYSTETLLNTTITWSDGHKLRASTKSVDSSSSHTTKTYDTQSETIVTTTDAASPSPTAPYCDPHGRCFNPPCCSYTVPGPIICSCDAYTRASLKSDYATPISQPSSSTEITSESPTSLAASSSSLPSVSVVTVYSSVIVTVVEQEYVTAFMAPNTSTASNSWESSKVLPSARKRQAETTDGRCSWPDQTCYGWPGGECCNTFSGWCGSGGDYCAPLLCDPQLGVCDNAPEVCPGCPEKRGESRDGLGNPRAFVARQNSNSTMCGDPDNTCFNSTAGDCCSVYGWCGTGPEFCSKKTCDPDWGYCGGNGTDDGDDYLNQNETYWQWLVQKTKRDGRNTTVQLDVSTAVVIVSTIQTTVTASKSVVYVNEATVNSGFNVTQTSLHTVLPLSGDGPSAVGYTTLTAPGLSAFNATAVTNASVTLTDPLNSKITTVVPYVSGSVSCTEHINNTSIDTESYINISTFSMSQISTSGVNASTTSVPVSTTPRASFSSSPKSTFMPGAITSHLGKNTSSNGTRATEVGGSHLPMLAAFGLAGVMGLFFLL